nr:hypothetical protein [Planomonospora sphaerica]
MAVVEETETGVVSATGGALSLLALGFGQDPAPGLQLFYRPVELFAGDAGQSGME